VSGRLLRILGVGFGLAISIGNTIAAGIVRAPGEIAAGAGSRWAFLGLWAAGGLYALLGANCLAELGTALPRSGGQYVFSRRALGEYPGFIVGVSDWLSTCGSIAVVAFVCAEYLEVLLGASRGGRTAIAIVLTISFALLQWRGLRWGSAVQDLTSLAKAVALLALVAACFIVGAGPDRGTPPARGPAGTPGLLAGLLVGLQSVIYTYDGWAGPIYFSGETREAGRSLPLSLLGGVLSVIAIYLLVNLALLHVLPLSGIAGDDFALGSAASAVLGSAGDPIARWVMVISMLAGLNAYHLMASRVAHALGSDGLFTRAMGDVNPGGTPAVSLWTGTAAAVLFIVLSGAFKPLIAALSFFFVANYALSFLSLFALRRREPLLPRPYRAWGHPFTTALALGGSVAFLIGAIVQDLRSGERSSIHALALLVASYPAFRLLKLGKGGAA
jgi:basic amino acid/polyamine antiporter, APA family